MNQPIMRTVLTAAALAAVLPVLAAGTACADEFHENSHNAPRVALVNTGQIDDPLEDVLEHTAILGRTQVVEAPEAPGQD
ncbi:hypothetical protein ACH4SP_18475 [Streptomyces sp. NPDC021093]|uniref:hypothetical protein n=1 Tax=Streptomyces sp. NPDC021093 TaxID=3365112 RepID=UPI0037B05430